MKILRIIADSDPRNGGPIEGARRFASVWARQGHQQDLLTLDAPGDNHLYDYPGEIFKLGQPRTKNPLSRYRYSSKMIPWLKRHAAEYDAILVSGLWRYNALAARMALVGGKTPYFVLPHGMLDPWFRKTYPIKHLAKQISWWISEGPLLNGAKHVLFTSEEEMISADRAFWPYHAKGLVINYGAQDISGDPEKQISAFRASIPEKLSSRYILFLSRIHPKKGCDLLIEAFIKVAQRYPDVDLVVAGPDQTGLVNDFKRIADNAGFGNRIHFPGMLSGDVKSGAFRGAEAFILPSHQENFGIVVAESLSFGTPVLISNKVNIWREIERDRVGFVRDDTLNGTVSLLEDFLKLTPNKILRMRDLARESFLYRFHVENAATNLIRIIENTTEVS